MNRLVLPPGAFRLLLALMVMLSHLSAINIGRIGVILFFVLSGYWISDLWRRHSGGVGLFFVNRFLRIWPLYIICAFAVAGLFHRPFGAQHAALLGIASSKNALIGVEWSLDIEAQFYLILPLMMAFKQKFWIAFLGITGFVGGWIMFDLFQIRSVLMYLPAFVAGIAIYRAPHLFEKIRPNTSLICTTIFTILTLIFSGMLYKTADRGLDDDIFAMIWSLFLLPYVAASLRIRSGIFDRHLGNLSFPLYLVHYPIIQTILGTASHSLQMKVVASIASILLAVLIYILIDVPIERFRKFLLRRLQRQTGGKTHPDAFPRIT